MTPERDLGQQRVAAELGADAAARDAQWRIQQYQQQLRAGLLDPRAARRGRGSQWRALVASLGRTYSSLLRLIS